MSQLQAGFALSTIALSSFMGQEDYVNELRAAEDHADVSLHEAIVIAEAAEPDVHAVRAALLVDGVPRYAVRARSGERAWKFLVSLKGTVEAKSPDVAPAPSGTPSIRLVEALAIAEDEAGGTAVAVAPAENMPGAFDIHVLTPFALWEVKVSGAGRVLERTAEA